MRQKQRWAMAFAIPAIVLGWLLAYGQAWEWMQSW